MSVYILKRFGIISFLFITITCNVNSGHSTSQKVPLNDTLKIEGCQAKIKMKVGSIFTAIGKFQKVTRYCYTA